MATPTKYRLKEKETCLYSFTLKDENGNAVALASLGSATLTLKTLHTNATVNARSAQNVLNLNNVTIHATSGLVTWDLQLGDVTILDDSRRIETHRATFVFTWGGGANSKPHEVDFELENLDALT